LSEGCRYKQVKTLLDMLFIEAVFEKNGNISHDLQAVALNGLNSVLFLVLSLNGCSLFLLFFFKFVDHVVFTRVGSIELLV